MNIKLLPALFFLLLLLTACGDDADKTRVRGQSKPFSEQTNKVGNVGTEVGDIAGIFAAYPTKQVAAHTYVIHGPREMPNKANRGFMNNPAFVVTDKSVIVIDPGSSVQVGRALVARIKEVTHNPVTHVFDTHIHGDHWLGNQGIQEAFPDATFYAHPKMIEKANAGAAEEWVSLMLSLTGNATAGTKPVVPKNALQSGQQFSVDNITIKTHVGAGKAHTETDVMYQVVEDKVLFTGDNVTNLRIPRMDDGSFAGSIAVADYALSLPVDVVVPGHGPTGDKRVIRAYQKYLSIVYNESGLLTEEGLEPFEMKDAILQKLADYQDWSGLQEEVGRHISLAVIEAEAADF